MIVVIKPDLHLDFAKASRANLISDVRNSVSLCVFFSLKMLKVRAALSASACS